MTGVIIDDAAAARRERDRHRDGRFGRRRGAAPQSTLADDGPSVAGTAGVPEAFDRSGWRRMTVEQREALVEPYWVAYLARRAVLDAAGKFPYDDDFKGCLPGLDPATSRTTPEAEGTAVYLLQQRHRRTQDRAARDAFLAAGGRPVTAADVPEGVQLRGDVAEFGFYTGGTGFQVRRGVRVRGDGHGRLFVLPHRARTRGVYLQGEVFILEEPAGRPHS